MDKVSNKPVTEVVSVASEEKRTGVKNELPSPEELRSRAAASFIKHKTLLQQEFEKLSSRQKCRVMNSILDLPQEGLSVGLRTDEEKRCFAWGQKIISDRFLLTYYHIVEQHTQDKIEEQLNKETKTE